MSRLPALAAAIAIRFACAQLGEPYVWGGNGEAGWDCSDLTTAAHTAAGIQLPRHTQAQHQAGPLVPAGKPFVPGAWFSTADGAASRPTSDLRVQ